MFFTPDGNIRENWLPTGTETSFTLSRILAPLAENQQSVVVLDGIENKVGGYSAHPGDDHMKGMGTMLTGIGLLPGNIQGGAGDPAGLAGGISVDQQIAATIGASTKFRSLELGVQAGSAGTVWGYTAYSGANQPLPPDDNPASVWNRVFAAFGGDAALLRQQAERKSVLDAVMQSYNKLNPRLGALDKAKLDEHLGNIRDLETAAAAPRHHGRRVHEAGDAGHDRLQGQRQLPGGRQAADGSAGDGDGVRPHARGHHPVGAVGRRHPVHLGRPGDHARPPRHVSRRRHRDRHHRDAHQDQHLVRAAAQLPARTRCKNAKEADGSSLLDNTLVIWCNELSRGNVHSHDHMPFVLAGGAGGALRTGRFLSYGKSVSHNNLLVSCMNLMGVPATTFGDPAFCTGPLANL